MEVGCLPPTPLPGLRAGVPGLPEPDRATAADPEHVLLSVAARWVVEHRRRGTRGVVVAVLPLRQPASR